MTRKHVARKNPASSRKKSSRLLWMWVMLGAVLLVAVVMVAFNLIPAPTAPAASPTSMVQLLTPAQAYARLEAGAFFLDVRTQDEWNDFHIAGSHLVPLTELQDRLGEIPRDQDIVVVCQTGHRSLSGANLLVQQGFTRVSSLDGGLTAWMAANYPVEK
jgi:rhodanese-related sulfurtransferase